MTSSRANRRPRRLPSRLVVLVAALATFSGMLPAARSAVATAATIPTKTVQWTATPAGTFQSQSFTFTLTAPCPVADQVSAGPAACGASTSPVVCDFANDPGGQSLYATLTQVRQVIKNDELHMSFTATCPTGQQLLQASVQGSFFQLTSPLADQAFWQLDWPVPGNSYLLSDPAQVGLSRITWDNASSPAKFSAQVDVSNAAQYPAPCAQNACGWAIQGGNPDATGTIVADQSYLDFLASGNEPAGTDTFAVTTSGALNLPYADMRAVLTAGLGNIQIASAWVPTRQHLVADYNIDSIAEGLAVAGVSVDELCIDIALIPAPNLTGDSVDDPGKVCLAKEASGASISVILTTLVTAFGAAILIPLVGETGHKQKPVPAPGPGLTPPDPLQIPLPPITPPPDAVQSVVDVWLQRMTVSSGIGPSTLLALQPNPINNEVLKKAARRCLQLAGAAMYAGVAFGSANPCEDLPILFPAGTSDPQVPAQYNAYEAAQHDEDAILSHAQWFQLNYMSSTFKQDQVPRDWYTIPPYSRQGDCATKTSDQACDEYPLYATTQGGPLAMGGDGATLRAVNAKQNFQEGLVYGAMVNTIGCGVGINSAPPVPRGVHAPGGAPFLVVPLPGVPVPSFFMCGLTVPTNGNQGGGGGGGGGGQVT